MIEYLPRTDIRLTNTYKFLKTGACWSAGILSAHVFCAGGLFRRNAMDVVLMEKKRTEKSLKKFFDISCCITAGNYI
jgi:hypothetical protein